MGFLVFRQMALRTYRTVAVISGKKLLCLGKTGLKG
jgi:hypothetical protein